MEENLMKLCQIESFTRRFTSPRRDDMLLCLGNNVKSSLSLEEANICMYSKYICIHTCCQSDIAVNIEDRQEK